IDDLYQRAAVLKNPPGYDVLQNAGFEEPPKPGGAIVGWVTDKAASAARRNPLDHIIPVSDPSAKLDEHDPHSGRRSVKLSRATGGSLKSHPFPAPRTGWLSVSVWMRVADATRQPRLRLALEGKRGAAAYHREVPIGDGDGNPKLSETWTQYVFEFANVPTEGLSPLHLQFYFVDPGEVWIDDVQLFDLERLQPQQRLALANAFEFAERKLKNGQYGDCLRQLEGYWPRFLTSNVTVAPNPAARTARQPRPAAATEAKPGALDRVKGIFDGLWR
ncbi:MAG TPA: hypothetical protein VGX76_12560, partial [Pirellulales bacterium]|nr:hypothetical protein [Pirellulales bacterium]